MLDDDIEYIGTSLPFDNRIVTGIILRVDKSADDPACTLTFRRAISNVVHIGRRPSNEDRIQSDKHSAMFRCAVVSRKHAKITFSDSGHVYLIDMNSHHGTHVRKPNEAVSTMLKSETPAKLSDGDIITFGKSVGRHNEYVRPIVARAELLYGPRESISKPVAPVKQIVHLDLTESPPPKSNSGRYGIYRQLSPSSDNNSSSMSEDSDIEEISSSIPASGPNALPLPPRPPYKPELAPSPIGRAIEALKRFLPPAHATNTSSLPLPQIRPLYTPSPDSERSLDSGFSQHDLYNPLYSPRSSEWPRSPCWSPPPAESNRLQSPLFDFSYCEPIPVRDLRQDEHCHKDLSRSHSPMDLASPSPVIPQRNLDADQSLPEEPSVIGAWPASRSVSPEPPSSPVPKESTVDVLETPTELFPPLMQKAMSLGSICSEPFSQNNDDVESSPAPDPMEDESNIQEETLSHTTNNGSDEHTPDADSEIKGFQLSIQKLEDEVYKLQTYRRKYKVRFNNNVRLLTDKLSNLDERVSDVHAQYMMLVDRVDSAVDVDIPDLQVQLDALREQIEAYPVPTNSDVPTEPLHKRADVEANIAAIHSLVADMRVLHERTAEQMDAELCLVREARDAALAQIAAHVEAQAQTASSSVSTPLSLKRKHSDVDDDDTDCAVGDSIEENGAGAGDAMMADSAAPYPVPATAPVAVCCHQHGSESIRPSKRARRIATVAAQTATAVTVGAIATWSALAFS